MRNCILLLLFICFITCSKGISDLNTIHFYNGSIDIVVTDSVKLYENLGILLEYSGVEITLEGYTNSVGSDTSNLALSQARADILWDWLVDRGVDYTRMIPIGYGENNPVGDNFTAEGRALNDRVEFNIQ